MVQIFVHSSYPGSKLTELVWRTTFHIFLQNSNTEWKTRAGLRSLSLVDSTVDAGRDQKVVSDPSLSIPQVQMNIAYIKDSLFSFTPNFE